MPSMSGSRRTSPVDPRPLVGEPLGLDLLNTIWNESGRRHDLLADLAGTDVWLLSNELGDEVPRTAGTRDSLLEAREALATHIGCPDAPGAADGVNAVLARGVLVRTLTTDGPTTTARVDDPVHLPGWMAVESYLQLRERDATRIRPCAHPDCVLHFYDTSRKGNRRWCSMAACGNRAKAARHYARTHGSDTERSDTEP